MNCPKCQSPIYGSSCSCGWKPRKRGEPDGESLPPNLTVCSVAGCENDPDHLFTTLRNADGKTFTPKILMRKYVHKSGGKYQLIEGYSFVEQVARCDDCLRREIEKTDSERWSDKMLRTFITDKDEYARIFRPPNLEPKYDKNKRHA